jgi:hypothetical protein
MEQHYTAKSKGTWGREAAKTGEELNRLCNDFFEKLVVPPEWKNMGWSNALDTSTGILYSVGKLFRDMRTSGIDLMHYRVYFNSFSCKGGICSKSIVDFGKFKYHTEVNNKDIEKLNEWIAEHYNVLVTESDDTENEINEEDGLSRFRENLNE